MPLSLLLTALLKNIHLLSPLFKEELGIKQKKGKNPQLRLIQGGYPRRISLGPIDIVAAPENTPPFPVDAIAVEEDTFLVVSADRQVRDPHIPLMRVMTKLIETRPKSPGTVLATGKHPLRLLAIVHDFDQEPSWREEWIVSALDGIFRETELRKLKSIALPMLGTLHGSLEKQRFVVLLRNCLNRISLSHLKRLWLVVHGETGSKIFEILKLGKEKREG